jgi:hypothetical protein
MRSSLSPERPVSELNRKYIHTAAAVLLKSVLAKELQTIVLSFFSE